MRLPETILFAINKLESAGFSAYAVGGCVRDSMLGVQPHDWDIATSAAPGEISRVFEGFYTVDIGAAHGTVGVILDGKAVEITAFRIDGAYSDGRRPDSVAFTDDPVRDLARRDFTVNAMAYSPKGGLLDPFGGQADLDRRILRCVGEPARRFEEDGLRVLRALRFASVLGFEIEPATSAAVHACKGMLYHVSPERIAAELSRLLPGENAPAVLREFPDVLGVFIPEILPTVGFDQHNPYHDRDIWAHTCDAVGHAPTMLRLRMTMLFHDLGKPARHTTDTRGIGHFYGHDAVSADIARARLQALRYDKATVDTVALLCSRHSVDIKPTEKSVLRWLSKLGEARLRDLLAVMRADNMAKSALAADSVAEVGEVERVLGQILAEGKCFSLQSLAVNGTDLAALGLSGPQIGSMLRTLLGAVIAGKCANERGALLAYARRRQSP